MVVAVVQRPAVIGSAAPLPAKESDPDTASRAVMSANGRLAAGRSARLQQAELEGVPGASAVRLPGREPAEPFGTEGDPRAASEEGGRDLPGTQSLRQATRLINRMLEESRRRLKFNVHEQTGRIWVQVIDLDSQEVIKEIPPERYLDLVARIWELVGLLVDERA